MVTRRAFLTTGLRVALLAMLLPFLPPAVKRAQAEKQPDGSVLFDGCNDYLRAQPFYMNDLPQPVYLLARSDEPYAWLKVKAVRVFPEAHDEARRKLEIEKLLREQG